MTDLPRAARRRLGATLVLAALLMTLLVGMIAFAMDIGYIVLVRSQLQSAADSAAMAAASVMAGDSKEVVSTARQFAALNMAGGRQVKLDSTDIEFGVWDSDTRTFEPSSGSGNAIRITARHATRSPNGTSPLFFGRIFGRDSFETSAQAVAMANPRDIAFVVDLSGSMNDDTEPAWATKAINDTFGPQGYPNIGNTVMSTLYQDFGFGSFPGTSEHPGKPLGVASGNYAYANLTKDTGPLATIANAAYKILPSDTEAQRKKKAYSWMIDVQLKNLMPNAQPALDSTTNYAYWEAYLDYTLIAVTIKPATTTTGSGSSSSGSSSSGSSSSGSGSSSGGTSGSGSSTPATPPTPKPPIGRWSPRDPARELFTWRDELRAELQPGASRPLEDVQLVFNARTEAERLLMQTLLAAGQVPQGTPPDDRGTIPPNQGSDRITAFNNPNLSTFPSAPSPNSYRNQLGYRTYAQFMMDFGRDLKPKNTRVTPLSLAAPDCPKHVESTAGGSFEFPPREQPMHAVRRALIAGLQVVKDRNDVVPSPTQKDYVSIVSYDSIDGANKPIIRQGLTTDYVNAMQACTQLQAVGDKGMTTATETGLIEARKHIRPLNVGGLGRKYANKVVVLLTDGVPNAYSSSATDINKEILKAKSAFGAAGGEYYNNGALWLDAPIMQAYRFAADKWRLFNVGIGMGTDYDFMDRMARAAQTASGAGQSPRGSGNPAEYEQRLIEMFEEIIENPQVRLVQ